MCEGAAPNSPGSMRNPFGQERHKETLATLCLYVVHEFIHLSLAVKSFAAFHFLSTKPLHQFIRELDQER
jgi:hypothetical protein